MRHFTEQELVRRSKLDFFKENNIDAFGQKFVVTSNSEEIKQKFDSFDKEKLEELHEHVIIAGRIMTKEKRVKRDSCIYKINLDKFKFMLEKML